jgi:PmbA protein
MSTNSETISQKAIEYAKTLGADSAEVFLMHSTRQKIDVRDGAVEETKYAVESGLGIRVYKNKSVGFSSTANLSDEVLSRTVSQALENALVATPDEFNVLPKLALSSRGDVASGVDLKILDQNITSTSPEKKIALVKQIETIAYQFDKRVKKTELVSYSDALYSITLANSLGQLGTYSGTYCGASAELIAEEGHQAEAGSGSQFVVNLSELDPVYIGEEAAKAATQLLSAGSTQTAQTTVVFDRQVTAQFLEAVSPMFLSSYVQKGKSLLRGKLGESIASPLITLLDSGRIPGALGTAPFDAEGILTNETSLIEGGTLKAYLYDFHTALKAGVLSTGNAARGGYKTLPDVSTTNFYLKPGSRSQAQLTQSVSNGILITKVMGMHTANPISGDFSVGAAGILIEGGKLTRPVRGIAIAGNLLKMLSQVQEVGADLRWFGSTGAPSLLIDGITVSGK